MATVNAYIRKACDYLDLARECLQQNDVREAGRNQRKAEIWFEKAEEKRDEIRENAMLDGRY